MALTASPYGLRAVNLIGGLPYAGSTRQIPITANYAVNIFNGSVVVITSAGTCELMVTPSLGTAANPFPAGTIGVFVGCSYTNPSTKQKVFAQYWPASTIASDAVAYVVDDDRVVFQAQADGTLAQTALGNNINLKAVQSTSTGSTLNGNSTSALDYTSAASTTGISLRIVDFVDMKGFSAVGDAFTDVLVKFNPVAHSYSNPLGI